MKPSVSIIIPVYNSEKYLEQTLDSIISQDDKRWECILVDDGSTDGSSDICERYSKNDSRFISIHLKNGGVSRARNTGIERATSELITFLDSDDWLQPSYVSTIIREMDGVDFLVFSSRIYNAEKKFVNLPSFLYGAYYDKKQVQNSLVSVAYPKDQLGWPWNKAYRRHLIVNHKIKFPEDLSFHEDEIFVIKYVQSINSVRLINDIIHNYRYTAQSLTTSVKPSSVYWEAINGLGYAIDSLESIELRGSLRRVIMNLYQRIIGSSLDEISKRKSIRMANDYYMKYRDEISPYADKKWNFIFGHNDILTYLIYNIIEKIG